MSNARATDTAPAFVRTAATRELIAVEKVPSAAVSSAMCDLNNLSRSWVPWCAFQSATSCFAKSVALAEACPLSHDKVVW